MATQSGYASSNCFTGFIAEDNVSDDGTAETIVKSINMHMANIPPIHPLPIKCIKLRKHHHLQCVDAAGCRKQGPTQQRSQSHAPMVCNDDDKSAQSPTILEPVFRPTCFPAQAATQCNFIPPAIPMLAPAQQWGQPPRGGGCGSNHSHNGRGRRNPCGPAQQGTSVPFAGGNQIIPYIPAGIQPTQHQNPQYSNVFKQWANQNVCFSCGFDVEDWHNSSTCPQKKVGHQDGLTRSNYLEYKWANHLFCCKAMHKTMYPNM